MSVELNHTIVHAYDKVASANFMSEILGLEPPQPFSHFLVVQAANNVSLDFLETKEKIVPQHYAFLVSDGEFDTIFGRIQQRKLEYWADPAAREPGKINHRDGGRGVYFCDPAGNYLEILTRPYGSGGKG